MRVWLGFIWLTIGTSRKLFEYGNEHLGSAREWKCYGQLGDRILEKHYSYAPLVPLVTALH
jgi:hypothetical protein